MNTIDFEEIEVPDTPPLPKSKGGYHPPDSPPSTPTSPYPPSPGDERGGGGKGGKGGTGGSDKSVDRGKADKSVDRGKADKSVDREKADKGGSKRRGNIQIKKQCSKIFRFKTKILQNLGKADKTTDEVFDEYEANFARQQSNANRLHKEVSNYLRCCRALHGASKSLFETLGEVYEPEWVGHDLLYAQSQNSDMLWTDFCHKLQDQTLTPLTAYQMQFPEIRKRIDKRGRKLVDYDSQRHQLENLQRATRRDEYKIARARDTLENARVTYEGLNKVAKELDAIVEKLSKECAKGTYKTKRVAAPRPLSMAVDSPPSHHQKSPGSPSMWYDGEVEREDEEEEQLAGEKNRTNSKGESAFGEDAKEADFPPSPSSPSSNPNSPSPLSPPVPPPPAVAASMSSSNSSSSPAVLPLSNEVSSSTGLPPYVPSPSSGLSVEGGGGGGGGGLGGGEEGEEEEGGNGGENETSPPTPHRKEETLGRPYEEIEFEEKKLNGSVSPPRTNGDFIGTKIPAASFSGEGGGGGGGGGADHPPPHTPSPPSEPVAAPTESHSEQIYDIPVGATTDNLPPGVLYRVRATYKYTREDVDEISFEVGDVIQVVEYDDPEEQEEGWLCGVKETTLEKGLFPANFTRPI
ncbi:amphiphysin-like [Penaeus indicus]|uniref:amphiphysin-like n=1 Tax=Penaeus indicus TaxID=29960 RepID=UPI00300D5858